MFADIVFFDDMDIIVISQWQKIQFRIDDTKNMTGRNILQDTSVQLKIYLKT